MKKMIAVLLCVLLLVGILPTWAYASNGENIVILYENDVHCAVEGYSKLSALKKELQETHAYVGVVSGGDYVQGSSLGVISKGAYIVNLMNLVGYDAVALGNHEFDYRLNRLEELVALMDTKPVCSNFQKIGEESSFFKPYSMVRYGGVDVAYIGITTPSTITSSSPAQFKDENGEYLYTFNPTTLYEVVQSNIDAAKAEGADYIIALSHVGYADDEVYGQWADVEDLIRNTNGLDVVLDAHSHTVIEGMKIKDQGGHDVLLTSTGTKFEYIGKLTISGDDVKTRLIKTEDYQGADAAVESYLAQIKEECAQMGERKVAFSEVDLITHDPEGNRLVRTAETNLGDLCAEALRYAVDSDIGYVNGGGLRAAVSQGEITFNDLLNVFPFNNSIVLAEVTGQTIKDMMEMAVMSWPAEDGSFPHLSGITFSVNAAIPTSVVINEFEEFVGVDGAYRVYDLKIYNRETDKYEPMNLDQTYTIAAFNYFLLEYGGGMNMLENATIIQNDGMLDVEALELYVTEALGGTIGQEYGKVKVNVTFTDGEIIDETEPDTPDVEIEENPKTGDYGCLVVCTLMIAGSCVLAVVNDKRCKADM